MWLPCPGLMIRYLFFYERILATLIDDPDFAIPYWHWDNQADTTPLPNAMPAILNDPVKYPALFDPLRDQYNTRPGNIINLSYQTEFHMDAQSGTRARWNVLVPRSPLFENWNPNVTALRLWAGIDGPVDAWPVRLRACLPACLQWTSCGTSTTR